MSNNVTSKDIAKLDIEKSRKVRPDLWAEIDESLALNQQRVDAFLATGKSAIPDYEGDMAEPLPPLTPEEREVWDAIVIKNYESPK